MSPLQQRAGIRGLPLEDLDEYSDGFWKRKRNGSSSMNWSCARLLTPERDEQLAPAVMTKTTLLRIREEHGLAE
jgi:hypothetical protein